MKVLIVSDNHRYDTYLEQVIKEEAPFDCFIHLGDATGSEDYIRTIVNCPTYMVRGNNDFFCDLPKEQEFELAGNKILITHGHYYYVGQHTEEIRRQGRARNADIVMFGHTHRPYLDIGDEMTVLNPGSISYPRQENRKPSYIVMEIGSEGIVQYQIKYLEK